MDHAAMTRSLHHIMGSWYVYILRCSDGSFYTGVTTDPQRREQEHNRSARGARYTRSRRPVRLVYAATAGSRAEACRREWEIKQLSAGEKASLIAASPCPRRVPMGPDAVMNRQTDDALACWVYRSSRKDEMYLYLAAEDGFSQLPAELQRRFGTPIQVMPLQLHADRALAREDVRTVMRNLREQGYHLQLPPKLEPTLYHGE
jgi:predicted GIY-YIG superfamily endonuclease/uncharacterized protein YcgL (UPF0745 family)